MPESLVVRLQEHGSDDGGFTDVEIASPDLHVIIEAKRGWNIPTESQLRRYESRFAASGADRSRMVVLTQNGTRQVVARRLSGWQPPEPTELCVVGWSEVVALATAASSDGSQVERHLGAQLAVYLHGVSDMRDTNSNKVWVVPLATNAWDGWPADLTPIAEIERYRVYHYPSEGSYPKVVPNYIGFRYGGCLQSIHHVDDYEVVDSPFGYVPGAPQLQWEMPNFLLHLGPPMKPAQRVATGGLFGSARHTADLDLLLTSETVAEAVELTKKRRAE